MIQVPKDGYSGREERRRRTVVVVRRVPKVGDKGAVDGIARRGDRLELPYLDI
jgi:hypothetical protein